MSQPRFQEPSDEPRDYERERDIESERADLWRDQAVDREADEKEIK
jgi:hypothetical protein